MRGRRSAELATGDVVKFVSKIHTQVAADVLMAIPPAIDDAHRKIIMQDYDRARMHFVSVLTLKMGHWQEEPFFVFGIAHHVHAKAFKCYQHAMNSNSDHPLIKELKSERFAKDRALYEQLQGRLPVQEDPSDAPRIRGFIGKLRLTRTFERACEGTHALIHKEQKVVRTTELRWLRWPIAWDS